MKNKQKGSTVPLLVTIIALLIIGGGVYFYNSNKTSAPVTQNQESVPAPETQNQVKVSEEVCKDFPALSSFVLQNIQKPDNQKVLEMNPNVITSFRWKRKVSEPFITYPVMNGIEAYYGDEKTNRSADNIISTIKKNSDSLSQSIMNEAKNLGLTQNTMNTLPFQTFPNQDVIQVFAYEKDASLYSVSLVVKSGGHQALPQGSVRITCGKSLENFDKVYDALNPKANSSMKDPYNNDYVSIADVSSDNTVYAILGSSNQVKIADYYYFDGTRLKLISKDSYPVQCSTLQSQKVGMGMRCR